MKRHERCRIGGSPVKRATVKYHYFHRFFTYSMVRRRALPVARRPGGASASGVGRRPARRSGVARAADPRRRQCQVGSLAGAAHLSKTNAGVLRRAQRERKSRLEQKGKSSLDSALQYGDEPRKRGLSILWSFASLKPEVSEKLPQG